MIQVTIKVGVILSFAWWQQKSAAQLDRHYVLCCAVMLIVFLLFFEHMRLIKRPKYRKKMGANQVHAPNKQGALNNQSPRYMTLIELRASYRCLSQQQIQGGSHWCIPPPPPVYMPGGCLKVVYYSGAVNLLRLQEQQSVHRLVCYTVHVQCPLTEVPLYVCILSYTQQNVPSR